VGFQIHFAKKLRTHALAGKTGPGGLLPIADGGAGGVNALNLNPLYFGYNKYIGKGIDLCCDMSP